jgi:predicted flap endonuclease-1-like 5' DNA nuclease
LEKSLHARSNNNEFEKEDRMAKIIDIEGVGVVYAQKLKGIGIATTNALLEKGATPKGRKEIAEKSGISDSLILEWVNHVDLYRIRGVASEYSDLLEEAGVDTVRELAQRNAEHLFQKIAAVNQQKKLVRRIPTQKQVHDWIEQAKRLPGAITY